VTIKVAMPSLNHPLEGSGPPCLNLKCPFCGCEEQVGWDRFYNPRYHHCITCGKKYIYEPLTASVLCSKPGEVDCSRDPDCREREMFSGDNE